MAPTTDYRPTEAPASPFLDDGIMSTRVTSADSQQLQQHSPQNVVRFIPITEVDTASTTPTPPTLTDDDTNDDTYTLSTTPGFLTWPRFDEATLPPRKNARRSRLDSIFSPLRSVRAGLPGVSVDGLGGVIESAHGVFHSVRRMDFIETERALYLMRRHGDPPSSSLPRRELERYENELFDLSKYDGASDFLTVLCWTEESLAGCITLFTVSFGEAGEAIAIRPVAAMRDVPSPVLAKMRADERIRRKAVLRPRDEDDRTLEWRANPSRGPRYVRVGNRQNKPQNHVRSPSRSRSRAPGGGVADADGVCATIPQFVALLHARRSILEDAKSSPIALIATENGVRKPAVPLLQPPLSNPHEGDGVHVAVLVPNDALWAEEEIIWTGPAALGELRQRQYRRLIEHPPAQSRGRSRGRRREDGQDRRSGSMARQRSGSRGGW